MQYCHSVLRNSWNLWIRNEKKTPIYYKRKVKTLDNNIQTYCSDLFTVCPNLWFILKPLKLILLLLTVLELVVVVNVNTFQQICIHYYHLYLLM